MFSQQTSSGTSVPTTTTKTSSTTTSSTSSRSSSSSSSIARACARACEDRLYTPAINVCVDDLREVYLDSVGSNMSEQCERYLRKQLARGVPYLYYLYALQETGFAPRPSWRYTEAIVCRLTREHVSEDDLRFAIELRNEQSETNFDEEE